LPAPRPEPPAGFGRYQYAGGWGYESPAGEDFPGAPGGLILAGVNPDLPPISCCTSAPAGTTPRWAVSSSGIRSNSTVV